MIPSPKSLVERLVPERGLTFIRSRRVSLGDESGIALMVVIGLLVVGLLIAVVGVTAALSSSSLSTRDASVRRAQQAAEAGVQMQLYQQNEGNIDNYNLNGGPLGLSTVLDCVVPQLSVGVVTGLVNVAANTAGACPQSASGGVGTLTPNLVPIGDRASEVSELFLNQTALFGGAEREYLPTIVSIGSDNSRSPTVYSREVVQLAPVAPLQTIEGMGNVTIHGLTLAGLLSTVVAVNGNVYSKGSLTLPLLVAGVNLATSSGNLLPTWVGNPISGPVVSTATLDSGSSYASQVPTRPNVNISASKASCSVAANCTALGSDYNSAKDTFTMTNGTATFAPGDYVFCSFDATGGTLTASPGSSSNPSAAPVRIFIDSPSSARCASDTGDPNAGSFIASAGVNNSLTSTVTSALSASGVQIYVVGNGTTGGTSVQVGATATSCGLLCINPVTESMIIYAPSSNVTVNTGACLIGNLICTGGVFQGALIGNNVDVTAATITEDLDLGNYPLYAGINVFRPQQYTECSVSSSTGSAVTTLTGTESTDTSGC